MKRKAFSPAVRKTVISDLERLNELAVRSEAHWGFDEKHMKAFERENAITKDHIEKGYAFVIEKDDEILGFYENQKEVGTEISEKKEEFIT